MQLVAIIVSLAVTAVTIPVTVVAVRRMLAVVRAGGPAPGRTNDPAARTVNMVKETFLHTRMLQWTWIGALHWFVYLAFIVLATAVAQGFVQLFDPEFVWPIIGHFFLYEWVSEFIGLLGALAIIPLAIYRQVKHPKRLQRQSRFFGSRMGQAYFVEFMVFLESIAILFIRGAEYNLLQARGGEDAEYATGFHFPIAQHFGNLYPTGAENIGTLEDIIVAIAMIKVVSAMIWLLVISTNLTMGIAWHRFTAWPNIWFKRESDGGTALGGLKPILVNGEPLDLEKMEDLEEEDFEKLGVGIEGIGTTTLRVTGKPRINTDVDYAPSEDPIEAMSLIAAAIVTQSSITVRRVPIEFMEIELALLEEMGFRYDRSAEYAAENGQTRLVDITTYPSDLRAPIDKVHPMPFPGLNIDNLPFFAVIAATAQGQTLLHDWVYENRAIYLTELNKLGARVKLLDPHRVLVDGPTHWSGTEIVCPPALRPAVVILLAMLAAKGTSVLRSVYVINRGYEDLAERLNALGAQIETFRDI